MAFAPDAATDLTLCRQHAARATGKAGWSSPYAASHSTGSCPMRPPEKMIFLLGTLLPPSGRYISYCTAKPEEAPP
jgi:hypothetical protein